MCCGRTTMEVASLRTMSEPAQAFGEGPSAAKFEYVGKTAMTVVSPMTGKRYRFTKPGEQLEVEAMDRAWIAFVPNLIRV
jgi:hypothetical protein